MPPREAMEFDSSSALGGWLRHHHHPVLRALRLFIRSLPALCTVLLALGLYLATIGFPPPLVRTALRRLEERQGVALRIERLTLHPLHGLSAHGVRYFGRDDRPFPILDIERASLVTRPRDLLRRQPQARGIRLRNATIRIDPTPPAFGPPAGGPLLVRNISANLRFGKDPDIQITDLHATLLNTALRGGGTLRAEPDPGAPQVLTAGGPARFLDTIERPPPWFDTVVEQLNRIDLEGAPELEIRFHLAPPAWDRSTVHLQGGGGESKIRGIRIDEWRLAAELVENRLEVERFVVQDGANRFSLSGGYDFDTGLAEGRIVSSLPASYWLSLIPIAWRDGLREQGLFFEGTIACDATFGPAPLAQLLDHASGTLSLQRAEAFGIWVQEARLRFSHQEGDLRLSDVEAAIGPPVQRGVLQGSFAYDFTRHAFEGEVETKVDFHTLLPVLSEDMAALVRNATLTDQPAHATVRFMRTHPEEGAFSMQGRLQATNFLWRGSFVERLDSGLHYSNRVTRLDPFRAERPEGLAEGSIVVHGAKRRVDLHLSSSIDAHAAGRGAGPVLQGILDRFRFDGPTTARVDGVVFWGDPDGTLLTATATAYEAGYQALVADRVDLAVLVSNRHVAVHDIQADLFGGTLQGWFTTDPQPDETPTRNYRLQADAREIDFQQLASAFRQDEAEEQTGRLSGRLDLEGILNPAHPDVATGSGSIRIRDGTLLRIRLFGGLSRQLSRLIPGFGFATQTDFRANFEIADRRVQSDSVVVEGPIIHLTGAGSYGFDRSLDFDVRVRLLRDRAGLGRVIQLVTTPLFWWFEYDLEGTIDDPVWSARALPRDLLGERERPSQ